MQARLRRLFIVAAILVVGVAGCDIEASDSDDGGETPGPLEEAEVVRVVDGDTIIVLLDGREERLRYIGIDAPESVTPDQPVECFGPEAGDENALLVAGRPVLLEADAEDRDRFGRLLRYVYVRESNGDLVMINEALVANGFAEARSYPPNDRHQNQLSSAEQQAELSGAGLWGSC